jgi:hypothetical protein
LTAIVARFPHPWCNQIVTAFPYPGIRGRADTVTDAGIQSSVSNSASEIEQDWTRLDNIEEGGMRALKSSIA